MDQYPKSKSDFIDEVGLELDTETIPKLWVKKMFKNSKSCHLSIYLQRSETKTNISSKLFLDNEIMSEELKIDTINKQQAPVELYERGVKLLNGKNLFIVLVKNRLQIRVEPSSWVFRDFWGSSGISSRLNLVQLGHWL